jgi:glycosyltransferase involved in cell wall biosynthesis
MKILFVLFSLDAGGVTTATDILAGEMVKMGHSIKMLSLTDNPERQKKLEKQGFETETLGHKGLGLKTFILGFFQLSRYFAQNRDLDAMIVASAYPGIIATAAAKLTGNKAKILVNYHTHVSNYARHEPFFKRLILFFGQFILRLADVNANVSIDASRDAERYFGLKHVKTLYNPILPYTGKPASHRWFNDPDIIPIAACGRLSYVKDFALMIDALKIMLNYDPRYRLILIGSGELKDELIQHSIEQNLQDHIDFTGWLDEYLPLVECCKFFWMTSRYEGFGLVLVEALSTGIPCVSIDCPSGPREALESGKYGLLIESRDPETIAIGTHQFAHLPQHPREFYQQRAHDFLPEAVTRKYLEALNKSSERLN